MRFSRVGWLSTGYAPGAVDDYFAKVKVLLGSTDARHDLSPDEVRSVKFPLVRNGYDYRQVDAALDRVELQALERERAAHYGEESRQDVDDELERLHKIIRLARTRRFGRTGRLQRGYAVGEVDAFCDRLVGTLRGGRGPGLRAVRQVEFHPQFGGYSEDEVDAFLDRVVDVLLRRLVRP